jgi:rubrerythrin
MPRFYEIFKRIFCFIKSNYRSSNCVFTNFRIAHTATFTLASNNLALFDGDSVPFPRSILYLRLSALYITAKRHFDNSVGTEELGHMEMISAIVYQLTQGLCMDEIKKEGFSDYFVDHTTGIYPVSAGGIPFRMDYIASKGDLITDLHEDLAAEQKARTTYDNILRLVDDPDVKDVIRFLREREIVHYQRFGETMRTGWNRTSKERVAD